MTEIGREWEHQNWKFVGTSIAGVRTSLSVPALNLVFDVAQGLPFAINAHHFLITHGHMDHAGGIPYLISQKTMYKHKPPVFYMPPSLVEPMHEIMRTWQKIENHQYKYEFIGVEIGQTYELSKEYVFKPFRTVHRVESNGYTVYRRRKSLMTRYQGLSQPEIIQIRKTGQPVDETVFLPQISFTGDTQIEYLTLNPELSNTQILFTEVTYVDNRKTVAAAREWGHLHLEELLPLIPQMKNEKIVIIHLSSRYQRADVERLLNERLAPADRARVEVFPG